MFTKKFISFATALAACISVPLHASESNLRENERNSQRHSLTAELTQIVGQRYANTMRNLVATESREIQNKFTDFAKDCFKDYATEYLSGALRQQYGVLPTLSREESRSLLFDYINEKYSSLVDYINSISSRQIGSNIAEVEISGILNKSFSEDTQSIPTYEFPNCATRCVLNIFKKYLLEKQLHGEVQHVPHSNFQGDITDGKINIWVPEGNLSRYDISNCINRGFVYLENNVLQDSANYYIEKAYTETPYNSHYLAAGLMDKHFCDFFITKMFVNGLQLDCTLGFRNMGSSLAEGMALRRNRTQFIEFARNAAEFGPLGHDVENFSPTNSGPILARLTSLTVNTDSFNEVFRRSLTELVRSDVIANSQSYDLLKQRIKNLINVRFKNKIECCYLPLFSIDTSSRNLNDAISEESLINIFNKGKRGETASREQIDSLIRNIETYRH